LSGVKRGTDNQSVLVIIILRKAIMIIVLKSVDNSEQCN